MRLFLLLLLGFLLLPAPSPAAVQGPGYGVTLGEPVGATAKLWVDQDEAWVLGLGVNPAGGYSVQGTADYVLHIFEFGRFFNLPSLALATGLGARINGPDDGDYEPGLRFPAGLSYFLDAENIELFAEIAPVLDLSPEVELDLNAVAGIRFYGW
jgi:hypothetical protein